MVLGERIEEEEKETEETVSGPGGEEEAVETELASLTSLLGNINNTPVS